MLLALYFLAKNSIEVLKLFTIHLNSLFYYVTMTGAHLYTPHSLPLLQKITEGDFQAGYAMQR